MKGKKSRISLRGGLTLSLDLSRLCFTLEEGLKEGWPKWPYQMGMACGSIQVSWNAREYNFPHVKKERSLSLDYSYLDVCWLCYCWKQIAIFGSRVVVEKAEIGKKKGRIWLEKGFFSGDHILFSFFFKRCDFSLAIKICCYKQMESEERVQNASLWRRNQELFHVYIWQDCFGCAVSIRLSFVFWSGNEGLSKKRNCLFFRTIFFLKEFLYSWMRWRGIQWRRHGVILERF